MRRIASVALLAVASLSHAGFWGVSLASYTPTISTTGTGRVDQSGGVMSAGLTASQLTSFHTFPGDEKESSASVSVQVGIYAYWLVTGPNDNPGGLYLNTWISGSSNTSISGGYNTHGGDSWSQASASAYPSSAYSYDRRYYAVDTYAGSDGRSGWYKDSAPLNVNWIQVGTIDGKPFLRTADPIVFNGPSASVYGHIYGSVDWRAGSGAYVDAMSMSVAAAGLGYIIEPGPWLP